VHARGMRKLLALAMLLPSFALAQEEKTPDLHKIYVPYEKLNEVLGTDKERVMVPYKEFLELWKLKYGPKVDGSKPPVPYTVESASYDGKIASGIASFAAAIEIEVFDDGWQKIPLAFKDVAFEEVLVDGAPGVLAPAASGYDLILRGKGRHKVDLRLVAGVARGKEYATTAFGLPSVPLHRLTFRVPGKGTEVSIEPARAHTTTTEGEETVLLSFLGPQEAVKLTWRFQPEETEKEPPLLFSADTLDVRIEERTVRGTAHFDIEVLRSPTQEFAIAVPDKVQVLEVTGGNIKTWGFKDAARRQLRVSLHAEVTGKYALAVGFEGAIEVPGPLTIPSFRLEEAARESGYLRVASAEGVGVRPIALENVFQIDLNTLPESIKGGERSLGFRFPAMPYTLSVQTERIAPLVSLFTRARLDVERRTIKLNEALAFTVERAGLFTIRLEVPQGIALTDIGDPKLIDSWRESTEEGKRILTLELKGRRLGKFTIPISAEAPLDLAQGKLDVPLLKVLGVDREEGTLGIYMDPGIEAVATTTGLVPLEPQKLAAEDRWKSAQPLAFAWRWRGGEAKASFTVKARDPKVTCDVRYTLQAEESRVRVRADLAYAVEYTGVETFRFRMPKSVVDTVKIEGRNLREKQPSDDPIEEGKVPTVTWTVTLQSPALGEVLLHAEYDQVFPSALKTNESRDVAIPAVVPIGVERAHTYAAIRKSPVIKVETPTSDYEQIDPAELPEGLRSEEVFLALRRFEPPLPFPLRLEKHEYQPVADLVVQHVHIKTVVAGDDTATTTATFEVFNNDRQFLALRLPEGHDVQELLVSGKPQKPRIGQNRILLVPLLTGLRKDATFKVAIAYKHPIGTSGALFRETRFTGPELPRYEDSPAPAQMLLSWEVHYPNAWRVTSFTGNVTPAGADGADGSWLARGIAAISRYLEPGVPPGTAGARIGTPLPKFDDFVPMYTERESLKSLFTNGTGNGELVIHHISTGARIVFLLLGLLGGAGALIFLSRTFRPLASGGALLLLVLLLLAFSGRGWTPVWNVFLAATAATTLVVWVRERRRAS